MLRDLCFFQNYDLNNYDQGKAIVKNRKKIYEVTNKITNEKAIINKIGSFEAAPMFKDFKKIYLIYHPGFVNILNMQFIPKSRTQKEDKLIILYEYMKNGSIIKPLIKYFKSKGMNKEQMNPTIRNKIIFGVASTINFCNKKQIPYKELNPSNIYLDENYEPRISIGYSILMYTNICLTCIYKHDIFSPRYWKEADLKSEKYSVYQFGIFLYFMFCPTIRSYPKKIKKCNKIPGVYWDLIFQCVKEDPKEIPTIKQIIEELKDDKYLLDEFGLKANQFEVHQYQAKIEECDDVHLHFASLMNNIYA